MAFSVTEWWQRRGFEEELRRRQEEAAIHRIVNPYHAVGIKTSAGCCDQAQALKGRRFLSADAPKMPLEGCDAATCTCVYAHYDDRRVGRERRMRSAVPSKERRVGRGRRQNDG